MKKWLVVLLLLGLYQNWDEIKRAAHGSPKLREDEVLLYSTAACGYCTLTKKLLAEHDVPYTELDIERSADARAQLVGLTGRDGVPVLLVKGTVIEGYNKSLMLAVLYRH